MAGNGSVYTPSFKIDVGYNGGRVLNLHTYDSLSYIYSDETGRLANPHGSDGHRVLRVDSPKTIRRILQAAGRMPSDKFPIECDPARIYLAELGECPGGRPSGLIGVGVTERLKTSDGRPDKLLYVTKIAVTEPMQGQGIVGNEIFMSMLHDSPVILRTGRDSPANAFYERRHPVGHMERGPWFVYWWGVEDPGSALDEVFGKEVTLLGTGASPLSRGDIGIRPISL
jgi:hypothetical protein